MRHEHVDLCKGSWLRALLCRESVSAEEVAVVACHACSLLADELIQTCLEARVNFAVMPCCHGEPGARGDMVKELSETLGTPRDAVYDLMRLGAIDATPGFRARFRTIETAITPMNHVLIGSRETHVEEAKGRASRAGQLAKRASAALDPGNVRRRWSPAGQGRRALRRLEVATHMGDE